MKSFKLVAASIGTAAAMFAAGASAQSGGVLLPITITNASGNVADMTKAADGNPNTIWNAGAGPTQWIDIDLGSERMFSILRMLPSQNPAGNTVHHIWGRNDAGEWFDFGEVSGYTQDNQWIEYKNLKEIPVRTIVLQTTSSPSWVAWREFQVYDGGDLIESCHHNYPAGVAVYRTARLGRCPDYTFGASYFLRDTRNLPKGAEVYVCSTNQMNGWSWLANSNAPYSGTLPRQGRCGEYQNDSLFLMRKN
ncbi:F5/8 type C domain-containing protein [Delftia sp. 60]|uniref:discoidin domain-containing protein n=1 Tax=Delftia sp. 60 TaxID=2035216 RepID=UPI000C17E234|nr:discoidin domain-containing protein [Delftia sp. 60]PIF37850.1 F5/8 type C domain-containing protein [Burkholderiales bacterium 23]PIF66970.1 F5/8 type C domain-containing protein [Delftia sp. 60]